MSQEELLVAWIRQFERRPEDVERAAEKLRLARLKNKGRFDQTHRLRLKKIEEGDWVLVYDNNLNNQHRARRWFGPYKVTSANDNGTYHLADLDGTMMAIPVAGKRVKEFKKRHKGELDLGGMDDDDGWSEADNEPEGEE